MTAIGRTSAESKCKMFCCLSIVKPGGLFCIWPWGEETENQRENQFKQTESLSSKQEEEEDDCMKSKYVTQ